MKKFSFKIKVVLPVFFILLVFFTGMIIVSFNFFVSSIFLKDFANKYMSNVGSLILEKTTNYLRPVSEIVKLNSVLLKTNSEKKEKYLEHFNTVTMQQIRTIQQIALIYYGDKKGNFWMNAREKNNSISTEVINRKIDTEESNLILQEYQKKPQNTQEEINIVEKKIYPIIETYWQHRDNDSNIIGQEITKNYIYDPRTRPWYKNSVIQKKINWTDAYIFASSGKLLASGKPGITVSAPIYENGELIGVTAADIVLKEISDFLNTLQIGKSGRAFITNGDGDIIALKNYDEIIVTKNNNVSFNKINNISDKAITNSFTALLKEMLNENEVTLNLKESKSFSFNSGNSKYLGLYIPFPADIGLNWYVGIVVPENDFIGEMKNNLIIGIFISLFIMLIVIIISLYFSNKITVPLNILADQANQIKDFNINDDIEINSVFTEINKMTDAFVNMKSGLRSFKKYVPADLVRYLLSSGEEANLGGKYQDLTIFFTDIKDFTNITEKINPKDLVVYLGDYLENLSQIILDQKGTVDKYIGDSIMAFWNAPINVENHAYSACKAAVDCQYKLKEMGEISLKKNLPIFHTRIGINTGNVVVGNMGSEERLNYTVIGDSVNTASRLEGLCKQYNVSIIISESTYFHAKDSFTVRLLDKVIVKGKNQGVKIYELVDEINKVNEKYLEFINTFELGLNSYFGRNWKLAINYFTKAYNLNPGDKASVLFVKRCKLYEIKPPQEDWDGCFVYNIK